ncbi:MAG: Serine/arginine-rich splicing factor 1 [Paramarteilia canceri]
MVSARSVDRSESVYVGDLRSDIDERKLGRACNPYGDVRSIDIKRKEGFTYAFVEFYHIRDAEKCVDRGVVVDGVRCLVNFSRGMGKPREREPRGHSSNSRPFVQPFKTKYCAKLTKLPPSGSWQDIKDFIRRVCDVTYAKKTATREGIVYFRTSDDLNDAVRKLDRRTFRSHQDESSEVRMRAVTPSPTNTPVRDRRNSRSRSRSGGSYSSRDSSMSDHRRSYSSQRRESSGGSRERSRSYSSREKRNNSRDSGSSFSERSRSRS